MPMATRRFTVEEYERMGSAGILGEDDRLELLEGEIVEMSPIGAPHSSIVARLIRLLVGGLADSAVVRAQDPIRIPPRSMPQPDLAVVRPRDDFYVGAHPGPNDVLLLIEVSDSTAMFDRTVKMPMYARAGITQAWLVDLSANRIEDYRLGPDGSYGPAAVIEADDPIRIDAFPDVGLTARDILG